VEYFHVTYGYVDTEALTSEKEYLERLQEAVTPLKKGIHVFLDT